MAELEVHTHHGESGENPLVVPVSMTMSILAVLVAVATLFGHRAHTEELLLQAQATDQWAYYQAKKYSSTRNASDGGPAWRLYRSGQGKDRTAPRKISEGSPALQQR